MQMRLPFLQEAGHTFTIISRSGLPAAKGKGACSPILLMKTPPTLFFLAGLSVTPPLSAALPDWQAAVESAGNLPQVTYFKDLNGPAISGNAPLLLDIGTFTDRRTFEFVVNAGNAGSSGALMGLSGVQGLKFEQNFDTGNLGLTDYGVADYNSSIPAPLHQEAHLVFTSDGTDTLLYVNGTLQHTFAGSPLNLSGVVSLAAASDSFGAGIVDRLDGHILGFASYAAVLSPAEIALHYQELARDTLPANLPAWQEAVTSAGAVPAMTVFQPVSGAAPRLLNVGDFTGPRTFEFIAYAGDTGASGALMGRGGAQALKFEQWNNTGLMGLTAFGVADHTSATPSPILSFSQVAYVYDGSDTHLYLNGAWQHTFAGIPLNLNGNQALAAAGTISGEGTVITHRDPLEGQVLRFASYDTALDDTGVAALYEAFLKDEGAGEFTGWNDAATASGVIVKRLEPAAGNGQVTVDVGVLTGARSFEFIVNASLATPGGALMGGNVQALKFEQWNDTGSLGITAYGIADFNSFVPAPDSVDCHVVFSSNGTDTSLYLNGTLQYTFVGVALSATGLQGLANSAVLPILSATYFDRLDGHVLGFASYAEALTAEELEQHYTALTSAVGPPADPNFRITGLSRDAVSGNLTLTWNSTTGETYDIRYATGLSGFTGEAANNIAASAGLSTTHTFPSPVPGAPRLFFRVSRR